MSSTGGDSTAKLINSINTALKSAQDTTKSFNREVGGSVKVISNIAREFSKLDQSIKGSAKNIKAVSSALNSLNTTTGVKALQGFIDGVELATLYVKDLAKESKIAEESLRTMVPASLGLEKLESQLSRIIDEFEELNLATRELVEGSRDTVEGLDLVRGRLADVETQIKKNRIQTEIIADATGETAVKFDALGNAILKTSSRAKQTVPNVDKLTNSTRRLAGSGSQGARAFSDLAFRMNPLVSLYASIAVNIYAISEAFRVLNNAAGLERLYRQTANFAAALSGINVQSLARDLEAISGGAINAGEALRQATRGVSYGFTIAELEKLTETSRKASIALGINFQDAIDRAFRGIAKQEVEVLDEIGVVTRLDDAFAKYAATLGTTADKLTIVQRRIALTNEVIAQQEERFSGITIDSSGYELVAVSVGNAMDSILMNVAKATDGSMKKFATLIEGFRGIRSASTDAAESAKIYEAALKADNLSQAAVAYGQMQEFLEKARLEQIKGTKENEAYLKSVGQVEQAQKILNVVIGAGIVVTTKYVATLSVGLVRAMYGVVAGAISWATAETTKNAMVAISMGLTTAYTAVLAVFRGGMLAAAGAVLRFAGAMLLAAAPVLLTVAKFTALAGLVYILADSLNSFARDVLGVDIFGWIGDKIGWLWSKLKDFLAKVGIAVKDLAVDGLEGLTKVTGLDSISNDILGIGDAADEAAKKAKELDGYLNRVAVTGRKLSEVMSGGGIFGAPSLTREQGAANLDFDRASVDAMSDISASITEMTSQKSGLNDMVSSINTLAQIPVGLSLDPDLFKKLENNFKTLQEKGVIPLSMKFDEGKGVRDFAVVLDSLAKEVKQYETSGAFDVEIGVLRSTAVGDPFADLEKARRELQGLTQLLSAYNKVGSNINKDQREQLEQRRQLLKEELRIGAIKAEQRAIDEQIEIIKIKGQSSLALQEATTSQILKWEMSILEAQIVKYADSEIYTGELERQLRILKEQQATEEQSEAARRAKAAKENANKLGQDELGVKRDRAGSEVERVAIERRILDLKIEQAKSITDETERTRVLNELKHQGLILDDRARAAKARDAASITGNIAGLEGLTSLQSTFASSVSDMSSVWGNFQEQMRTGTSSFLEYLDGNIEGFATMTQAATALAQQAFAAMSQAKVDSISREIEAEKRRDGKSEESKAKIKALEAKRIKEEAKAKKASVIMSTAMAVMQTFAQLGPFGAPFAAVMTAMGVFQLAQIDKAASGQMAGLDSGGGNLSISGGNRSNSIDVSKAANAGELAYLQGKQGTGTSQNFTPGRAGGGFASAGTSITVGESGPEVITPAVPVNVERSGKSGGGSSIVFSPQYNLSSVDTQGMEELLERHSTALYKGLEKELQARNLTLENL